MRITHVSTVDVEGGAARAAYRLHRGLIELGAESRMLSVHKASADETVRKLQPWREPGAFELAYLDQLQREYVDSNRTAVSNTLFTVPYPGWDLTRLPDVTAADVINLHWVASFQSPISVDRMLRRKRAVVWTLHDMWPFTGGCHFSSGCTRYQRDCQPCPQLRDDPHGLPAAILRDRLTLTAHSHLTVVAPSRWLAACARESLVFRHTRIEVIPNSLQTDVFTPEPKREAKRLIGVDPDALILLGGAHDGRERRKGFHQLAEALGICAADPDFQRLLRDGRIKLVSFGIEPTGTGTFPVPVVPLGLIASDDMLRHVYSAADLFVLPSLEDNLPNTMLEAMSCGTPVVAFGVGGIPDVVDDGVTGRVVPLGAAPLMAAAILDGLRNHEARRAMGAAARRVIEARYSMPAQARRYLDLYQELVGEGGASPGCVGPERPEGALLGGEESANDLSVPVDGTLGPGAEPIFHRWALRAVWADLRAARDRGTALQFQVDQERAARERVQGELEESRTEAGALHGHIAAMESSKFWKLRQLWFEVKRALRIPLR